MTKVWDLWREGRALDIVDSMLIEIGLISHSQVIRSIQIGLLCVQEEAADRPTMPSVIVMLNGESMLPYPKQPAFIFRQNCSDPNLSTPAAVNFSLNKVTVTEVEARKRYCLFIHNKEN